MVIDNEICRVAALLALLYLKNVFKYVRFEVFTAMSMKEVFWDLVPCRCG
jgi:hypothetical protein